jgi:hypothetical protein
VCDVDGHACTFEPDADFGLRITKSQHTLLGYVRRAENELPESTPRLR